LARTVIVLDHLHGEPLVAQGPQLRDVVAHEHVAVHEDAPAFVAAEVGHQETREGEFGRLKRVARPGEDRAELREHERRDGDRLGAARLDAVREHAERDRLARVVAYEYAYHVMLR